MQSLNYLLLGVIEVVQQLTLLLPIFLIIDAAACTGEARVAPHVTVMGRSEKWQKAVVHLNVILNICAERQDKMW